MSSDPDPSSPSILSESIFAFGATPIIPIPLFPLAAMVPATCVPCPNTSDGSLSLATKSHPLTSSLYPLLSSSIPLSGISFGFVQILAARSSCVESIPVSSTATSTPSP